MQHYLTNEYSYNLEDLAKKVLSTIDSMLPSIYLWQLHLAVLKLQQRNDTVSRLLCEQDKGSDASAEDTALMDKMETPMALMVETEDGLDVGMLNFTRFVLTQRSKTNLVKFSIWLERKKRLWRLCRQTPQPD